MPVRASSRDLERGGTLISGDAIAAPNRGEVASEVNYASVIAASVTMRTRRRDDCWIGYPRIVGECVTKLGDDH